MKYLVKVRQYELHVAEHEIEVEGDVPRERAAAIGVAHVALSGMYAAPAGVAVEAGGDDCEVAFDEVARRSWQPLSVGKVRASALFDELRHVMSGAALQPTFFSGNVRVPSIHSVAVTKRRA